MLFAGLWSVRIVKNCDRGLENAARGCVFITIILYFHILYCMLYIVCCIIVA